MYIIDVDSSSSDAYRFLDKFDIRFRYERRSQFAIALQPSMLIDRNIAWKKFNQQNHVLETDFLFCNNFTLLALRINVSCM